MPFIIIPLIIGLIVVGLSSGSITLNLPAEVECPEGTVKTQFGNNFECLTKQEPTSGSVLPIPTPSPIPTSKPQVANKQPEATPRPTNKPQVEFTPQPTTDPDPIINCNFPHSGTKKLRRSECSKSTDCEIGKQWHVYTDENKCSGDQKAYWQQRLGNTYTSPTSTYNSGYTPKPLITCIVNYPCTGNSYTYQVDQESCNNFQQSALKICSSSQTNNTNSYVPPVEYDIQRSQDYYDALRREQYQDCLKLDKQEYDQIMIPLIAGNTSDSSIGERTIQEYESNKQQCAFLYQ